MSSPFQNGDMIPVSVPFTRLLSSAFTIFKTRLTSIPTPAAHFLLTRVACTTLPTRCSLFSRHRMLMKLPEAHFLHLSSLFPFANTFFFSQHTFIPTPQNAVETSHSHLPSPEQLVSLCKHVLLFTTHLSHTTE